MSRHYAKILKELENYLKKAASRDETMAAVSDLLWKHLQSHGVSWVGFYLKAPDSNTMTLGPRQPKPVCSPIELHGACGQAFLTNKPLIVHDVRELGENYIACDPKDRSELVIPIHASDGTPVGVLDLDSFDVGSFNETDLRGLTEILRLANLHKITD